jgi:hypothetical protein
MSEHVRKHPLKGQFDTAAASWERPDADDGTPGELEVGFADNGLVAIRRFDDPEGTLLIYTPEEWAAFVGGVKDGELDLAVLIQDAQDTSE